MRTILALDLSSHSGFALLHEHDGTVTLSDFGTIHLSKDRVADYGEFPYCYVEAAWEMAGQVVSKINQIQAEGTTLDAVVVEETNGGRANSYSQKLLEYVHCCFLSSLKSISRRPPVYYLATGVWRSKLGLKLSKEQRENNRKVGAANRSAKDAGGKKKARAAAGVKGRVTPKHLAVDFVNRQWGLQLLQRDNDAADAAAVGLAWLRGAVPSYPTRK